MTIISFLRPIDQPTGSLRFLHQLQVCLASPDYTHFRFAVAFAKCGPLLRLASAFEAWQAAGKIIEGIFGIDHLGTSRQALEFALSNFDRVYVTHLDASNTQRVTFHPKLYLFSGDQRATCFYGSHNLTVGGTETNFEDGVKIEFDRPGDDASLTEALACWESLLPEQCPGTRLLDEQLLVDLSRRGLLLDESKTGLPIAPRPMSSPHMTNSSPALFPTMYVKPPSPLPTNVIKSSSRRVRQSASTPLTTPLPVAPTTAVSQALVIQIIPHDNGEVHLSKKSLDQNPLFFDYPFTGITVPKKPSNRPYPQRIPDPLVDIIVYGSNGELLLQKLLFPLNTVYYDENAEIRITFSPDLVQAIPPYSIMVMVKNPHDAVSAYDMSVLVPGSQQYQDYLAVCNQTLPSGGKAQARKMGWL